MSGIARSIGLTLAPALYSGGRLFASGRAVLPSCAMSEPPPIAAFRPVPRTGVIYVTTEAQRRGFGVEPGWSNLGQGQPETGPLPEAPRRIESVAIPTDDQEYAPVAGIPELRE